MRNGPKSETDGVRRQARRIIEWMATGVYEKEQIAAMALLCAIAGENVFLLGPPGTAKSLVARRLKGVFEGARSFEYLMSRFSTPDEIFGPVSISRLKENDSYERLTDGYLPSADVVFLDEIWKAGPSIQNTLLTAINEHIYQNGTTTMRLPLKTLIAASNELPAPGDGLEALWDRFLVRMVSNCIEDDDNFELMLLDDIPEPCGGCEVSLSETDYRQWHDASRSISAACKIVDIVKALRRALRDVSRPEKTKSRMDYYVSDRRWKKIFRLMQTSAFLNGRREVDYSDVILLIHCLWNAPECRSEVINQVMNSMWQDISGRLQLLNQELTQLVSPADKDAQLRVVDVAESKLSEFYNSYYAVENYSGGAAALISKWDFRNLSYLEETEGIEFMDSSLRMLVLETAKSNRLFDMRMSSMGKPVKVRMMKCAGGVVINGVAYALVRKDQRDNAAEKTTRCRPKELTDLQKRFDGLCSDWMQLSESVIDEADANLFVSVSDIGLLKEAMAHVESEIADFRLRINNISRIVS